MAPSEHGDLPVLVGAGVTLRELRPADAATLFSLLTADQVVKFISPPPSSPDGFEKFIRWSIAERKQGRHFSFGIVPDGLTDPVGVFQIRILDRGSNVAEWGFVLAYSFWGTGIFPEAARLILEFVFDTLGVHRLEARAAVPNGRGHGALRKVSAVHEINLRESFYRNGIWFDQVFVVDYGTRVARTGACAARGGQAQRARGTRARGNEPRCPSRLAIGLARSPCRTLRG